MGCFPSKRNEADEGRRENTQQQLAQVAKSPLPPKLVQVYVTADPDLGWRNVTEATQNYPVVGFSLDFQNERSGSILKHIELARLAINIGCRANKLADRYGLVEEGGLASSSNLLEDLALMQGAETAEDESNWRVDIDRDMKRVLKQLGCPKFGWKLLSRALRTAPLIKKNPEIFLHEDSTTATALSELACVPDYLQCLVDQEGKHCLMDVGEIAINIAEQLFRLEKSEAKGYKVPTDTFGWKIVEVAPMQHPLDEQPRENFAVPIANSDGEALMMIPEEVVMNVASWVQQTYLTAPAF